MFLRLHMNHDIINNFKINDLICEKRHLTDSAV